MKKFISFIVGIIVLTLGVRIMYITGLGVGPWDSINIGLANMFNTEISKVLLVTSAIVIVISYFLSKTIPSIFTLATVLLIGYSLDIWTYVIGSDLVLFSNIYLVFIIGMLISSFGIALYLSSSFPQNPIDFFAISIKGALGVKIGTAKLITDFLCIIVAVLIKGPIGIGTVMACILIGPTINFINKVL